MIFLIYLFLIFHDIFWYRSSKGKEIFELFFSFQEEFHVREKKGIFEKENNFEGKVRGKKNGMVENFPREPLGVGPSWLKRFDLWGIEPQAESRNPYFRPPIIYLYYHL